MAIAEMTKVMVITHHSESAAVLETIQHAGLMQILKAEQGTASKEWPELTSNWERTKDTQHLVNRLEKAIAFLHGYAKKKSGIEAMLAPKESVPLNDYQRVVADQSTIELLEETEECSEQFESLVNKSETITGTIEKLEPWLPLDIPLEECVSSQRTTILMGYERTEFFHDTAAKLAEMGAVLTKVNTMDGLTACMVICLNENLGEAQKVLRASGFETVNFEGMLGRAADLIAQHKLRLEEIHEDLKGVRQRATSLARDILSIEMFHDYCSNLLKRESARESSAASDHTVIYEGWVRKGDYKALEKIIKKFTATTVATVPILEDEEIPVEIVNNAVLRPFEVITRLYGMPQRSEVDPTALLAPFYAIFFGLCLGDAGYGLIILLLSLYMAKKMQGDKRLVWLLFLCSMTTIIAGVLTGSYFGDGIQYMVNASQTWPGWGKSLANITSATRDRLLWFDPLTEPMTFFYLSIALGYTQIMFGLVIGMVINILKKDWIAAAVDQGAWLVLVNSAVLLGMGKAGLIPAVFGQAAPYSLTFAAAVIFLLSVRQGSWGTRLGMGAYQVFSSIFYMGDVLSYLRLMGLGMVSAGFAMAVNLIAKVCLEIPYVGFIIGVLVLVGGHSFSILLSTLGAFVHSLRLQFVEFFPKFMTGGGKAFEPLASDFKHIEIRNS